ncbi:MAG: hypothetical protein BWY84_01122 [Candidatus Aerophobetes bacterium ADurb.Bin490]|nr:MAG: hypothetical protein BWY84_01122 [Candidatus Aerophobetes bacterium ADurb.Bin490]
MFEITAVIKTAANMGAISIITFTIRSCAIKMTVSSVIFMVNAFPQ